jgi:hypothetical protein
VLVASRADLSTDFEPSFQTYIDPEGRALEYATVHHDGSTGLVVHLSAFFGSWADHRVYRDQFQGYFHRLRMLGSHRDYDWLFLCDTNGAFHNGTYYTGKAGDLFVERAIVEITGREMSDRGHGPERLVTVGSSMGATGAIVLGLLLEAAGVVAISPHVKLDVAAELCNRLDEVAFICPDRDPSNPGNHFVTRRIDGLLEAGASAKRLPRLFVQSTADDVGVHNEQVLPLVNAWREKGGSVDLDVRRVGGHEAIYGTRPLLLDAIAKIFAGDPIDVESYRTDPRFAATVLRKPLSHRIRSLLRLRTRYRVLRRWIRGRRSPTGAGSR